MTFPTLNARDLVALLLASVLAWPSAVAALTLEQALQIAEQEAPALAAQQASLTAAQQAAVPAGELPDPQLRLGLQNLPIEGEDRWQLDAESMTMQMVGVMQAVPNRAKRKARVETAQASVALAGAEQRLALLEVRQQTAEAWIEVLAVERKLAVFAHLYRENALLEKAVTARLAGGRGASADSIIPRQEQAVLADQEDLLHRDLTVARAELRRWVGGAAEQPLSGDWPAWRGDLTTYQANLDAHPALQAFDPLTRRSEAQIAEAVAGKTPDWAWGVDYQRRARGFGDMVSLNLTIDLPVFSGSRQDPLIASERARLDAVYAEREVQHRAYQRLLAEGVAELERLSRSLTRLEDTFLPLAEDRVRLALTDYRAGGGELTTVVAARQELIETRLRGIDLARDRALAAARLHFAFGETP